MPATYEPIATTTLGSAASTITFSSIPNTYTDLRVVLVPIGTASFGTRLNINSDTGSNYSLTYISGDGVNATSGRFSSQTTLYIDPTGTLTGTTPNLITVDIFSYAGSTNKTGLVEINADKNGSGRVLRDVILWRSTSAITSLTFAIDGTGNYNTGTTATLYGIKSA